MDGRHRSSSAGGRARGAGRLKPFSTQTLAPLWAALALAIGAAGVEAQSTRMPSTLRYGTGLLDVPVAGVAAHLTLLTTFSGFWTSHDTEILTNELGDAIGERPFEGGFRSDASITLGLFDRLEVGTTLQAFEGRTRGGDLIGAYGRLSLIPPEEHGMGLALGIRWLSGPDFGDGVDRAPGRLGGTDVRLRDPIAGKGAHTELTGYAVGTATLRGLDRGPLPRHDLTVTGGWGTGMFSAGDGLGWYELADSEGWFGGLVLHVELSRGRLLNLMGEWNGFDLNVGAQLDLGGLRVGAHVLGLNYPEDLSIYRSTKFGVLGSVALCLKELGTCRPQLLERPPPDTIALPAPPPDTVVVVRGTPPARPSDRVVELCLATGDAVEVLITVRGDTLMGPKRVSLSGVRPALVFAGTYAQGKAFYEDGGPVTFDGRRYASTASLIRANCAEIERAGEYRGVPLFADRGAARPPAAIYLPVRAGVWRRYEWDGR